MSASEEKSFGQKGDDVVAAAARLGELNKELEKANSDAARGPEAVGSWITAIGRAVLAIFGFSTKGGL